MSNFVNSKPANMTARDPSDEVGEVSLPIISPPTPLPPVSSPVSGSPSPASAFRHIPNYSYLRPNVSITPSPRNVSVALAATVSTDKTAFRGSVNSAKPSIWSVPDSIRSLVSSTAPISEEPRSSEDCGVALRRLYQRPDSKGDHTWHATQIDGCGSECGGTHHETSSKKRRSPRKLKRRNTNRSSVDSHSHYKVTATPKRNQAENDKKNPFIRLMTVMRLLHYISPGERLIFIVGMVGAVGSGCSLPMINVVFGQLVNSVLHYYAIPDPTDKQQQQFANTINGNALYIVYLACARFFFTYISNSIFPVTGLRISASIRHRYLDALLHLPISVLDSMPLGLTGHAMTTTSEYIQTCCGDQLAILVRTSAMIVSALVITFVYSWQLSLMICAGLTPIVGLYLATVPSVKKIMASVEEVNEQACDVVSEAFSMTKSIIGLCAQRDMEYRYNHWVSASTERGLRVCKLIALQQGGLAFVAYCCNALAFFWGMRLFLTSTNLDIGTIITVLGSMMLVPSSIGAFSQPIQAIAMTADHVNFIFNLIDSPTQHTAGIVPEDKQGGYDIELKHVCLSYRSRPGLKALNDVSFRIPAGKFTAIVGPSGSGKTSIVNLLERWYDLDPFQRFELRSGCIEYGGSPLTSIDMSWWRSRVGIVSQESFLFEDTIFANVAYGLVGSQFESEPESTKKSMVESACSEAMAMGFIQDLPNGLMTVINNSESQLTAGQQQQIAIARAIIKQPDILILDEATSALSGREEMLVHTALTKASENRTTIMISHRLSAIRNSDKVVVLVQGQVVQEGTQEELSRDQTGAYRTLALAQQLDLDNVNGLRRPTTWWRRKSGLVPLGFEGFEFTENKQWEENMRRGMDLMNVYSSQKPSGAVNRPSDLFTISFRLISERRELWPWYLFLIIGCIITGGATTMHTYVFVQQIVSFMTGHIMEDSVKFWCLMLVATAGGLGVSLMVSAWATTSLSLCLFESLRMEYFANTLQQSALFFDTKCHTPEALTAAITVDTDHLQRLLTSSTGAVLLSLSQVIGCLVISIYFGYVLALVAAGTIIPLIASALFFRIYDDIHTGQLNSEALERTARFAGTTISASRTITAYMLERTMLDKYAVYLTRHIDAAYNRQWASAVFLAFGESIPFFWIAFIAWFGVRFMTTREYVAFEFLIIFSVVVQQGISGSQWLGFSPNLTHAIAAAKRIISRRHDESPMDHLDAYSVVEEGNGCDKTRFDIEFLDVWLKYPLRESPVLTGLNIRVNHGQTIAIVGESGSGKSSIMSLLQRLYVPTNGMITLNGVNIQSKYLNAYRQSVAIVSQDPSLITGTLRDNIMFGAPRDTQEEDMYEAASQVGIHDLALSLSEGYDTPLGVRGSLLPEFHRLRVAIARALVRKPKLLLLDEVTENLSADEAVGIRETLERARVGRSVVIAEHRLENVRNSDMIYVVDDGNIVEFGNHDELMERRNVYYYMCLAQTLD